MIKYRNKERKDQTGNMKKRRRSKKTSKTKETPAKGN